MASPSSARDVSVVIPLYQAAPFITETLDSVAAQTVPARDVVVVDDGSTDGGADVAAAHPLRPRVIRQANGGPAKARNTAIRASSGALVAFLDADDLWQPNKLELQLEAFERAPNAGLCFGHAASFRDIDGRRTVWRTEVEPRRTSLESFLLGNQASTLTVMIPRRVYDEVGPIDERRSLWGVEDYHYWLEVLLCHPAVFVPHWIATYRERTDSLVGAEWSNNVSIGTRAVADVLCRHPELSWRLFHMTPALFLRFRILRELARSLGSPRVDWSGRLAVLRHLVRDAKLEEAGP